MVSGVIIAVIPSTNPILAMFEPITFPREISLNPSRAACILTNNSGAEVAKETTVSPMIIFDNLSLKDKPIAARTKNSPPTTKSAKPAIIKTILIGKI
jgi:hypothetical protein